MGKKLGEIKAILIRQVANTGLNLALHFSMSKYFAGSKPKSVAENNFFLFPKSQFSALTTQLSIFFH